MDENFPRNVDEELPNGPPTFGGRPGEPVPEVDPQDVKTAWQIGRDVEAGHPGQLVAVGIDVMKHACKPGADIQAVVYRSMLVWMMNHHAPEQLVRFMREGQPDDSVFRAAAKVRLEWMGVGVMRQGTPFDIDEFLRLCEETTKTA